MGANARLLAHPPGGVLHLWQSPTWGMKQRILSYHMTPVSQAIGHSSNHLGGGGGCTHLPLRPTRLAAVLCANPGLPAAQAQLREDNVCPGQTEAPGRQRAAAPEWAPGHSKATAELREPTGAPRSRGSAARALDR